MSAVQVLLDGLKYLLEQENPPSPEHLQMVIANTPHNDVILSLVIATMCWETPTLNAFLSLILRPHLRFNHSVDLITEEVIYPTRFLNYLFFDTFFLQLKELSYPQLISDLWLTNLASCIEATLIMANSVVQRVADGVPNVPSPQDPPDSNINYDNYNSQNNSEQDDNFLFSTGGLTERDWKSMSILIDYIFHFLVPTSGTFSIMWNNPNLEKPSVFHQGSFQSSSSKNIPISQVTIDSLNSYHQWIKLLHHNISALDPRICNIVPAVVQGSPDSGFSWGVPTLTFTLSVNIVRNLILKKIFANPYNRCRSIVVSLQASLDEDWINNVLQLEASIEQAEMSLIKDIIKKDSSVVYAVIVSCFNLLILCNHYQNGAEIALDDLKIKSILATIPSNSPLLKNNPLDLFHSFMLIRQASDALAPILKYQDDVFSEAINFYELSISLISMREYTSSRKYLFDHIGSFPHGILPKQTDNHYANSFAVNEEFASSSNDINEFFQIPRPESHQNLNSQKTQSIFTMKDYMLTDTLEILYLRDIITHLDKNDLSDSIVEILSQNLPPQFHQKSQAFSNKISNIDYNESLLVKDIAFLTRFVTGFIDIYSCPSVSYFANLFIQTKRCVPDLSSKFENEMSINTSLMKIDSFTKNWKVFKNHISSNDINSSSDYLYFTNILSDLELYKPDSQLPNIWERVKVFIDSNIYFLLRLGRGTGNMQIFHFLEIFNSKPIIKFSSALDLFCKKYEIPQSFDFNVLLGFYGSIYRISSIFPDFISNLDTENINFSIPNDPYNYFTDPKISFIKKWLIFFIIKGAGPLGTMFYFYQEVCDNESSDIFIESGLNKVIFDMLLLIKRIQIDSYTNNTSNAKINDPNSTNDLLISELLNLSMKINTTSLNVLNLAIGLDNLEIVDIQRYKSLAKSIVLHINKLYPPPLNAIKPATFHNTTGKRSRSQNDESVKLDKYFLFWQCLKKLSSTSPNTQDETSSIIELNKAAEKIMKISSKSQILIHRETKAYEIKPVSLYENMHFADNFPSNQNEPSNSFKKKIDSSNSDYQSKKPYRNTDLSNNANNSFDFDVNRPNPSGKRIGDKSFLNIDYIANILFQTSIHSRGSDFSDFFSGLVKHICANKYSNVLIGLILSKYISLDPGDGVDIVIGSLAEDIYNSTSVYNFENPLFASIQDLFVYNNPEDPENRDSNNIHWSQMDISSSKKSENLVNLPLSLKTVNLSILLFLTSLKYKNIMILASIYTWITDLLSVAHPSILNLYCLTITYLSIYEPKSVSKLSNKIDKEVYLFDDAYPQDNVWLNKVIFYLNRFKDNTPIFQRLIKPISLSFSKAFWNTSYDFMFYESEISKNYVSSQKTFPVQSWGNSKFSKVSNEMAIYLFEFFKKKITTKEHSEMVYFLLTSSVDMFEKYSSFQNFVEIMMPLNLKTPSDWFCVHFLPVILRILNRVRSEDEIKPGSPPNVNKLSADIIRSLISNYQFLFSLIPTIENNIVGHNENKLIYYSGSNISWDETILENFVSPIFPFERLFIYLTNSSLMDKKWFVFEVVEPRVNFLTRSVFLLSSTQEPLNVSLKNQSNTFNSYFPEINDPSINSENIDLIEKWSEGIYSNIFYPKSEKSSFSELSVINVSKKYPYSEEYLASFLANLYETHSSPEVIHLVKASLIRLFGIGSITERSDDFKKSIIEFIPSLSIAKVADSAPHRKSGNRISLLLLSSYSAEDILYVYSKLNMYLSFLLNSIMYSFPMISGSNNVKYKAINSRSYIIKPQNSETDLESLTEKENGLSENPIFQNVVLLLDSIFLTFTFASNRLKDESSKPERLNKFENKFNPVSKTIEDHFWTLYEDISLHDLKSSSSKSHLNENEPIPDVEIESFKSDFPQSFIVLQRIFSDYKDNEVGKTEKFIGNVQSSIYYNNLTSDSKRISHNSETVNSANLSPKSKIQMPNAQAYSSKQIIDQKLAKFIIRTYLDSYTLASSIGILMSLLEQIVKRDKRSIHHVKGTKLSNLLEKNGDISWASDYVDINKCEVGSDFDRYCQEMFYELSTSRAFVESVYGSMTFSTMTIFDGCHQLVTDFLDLIYKFGISYEESEGIVDSKVKKISRL
ncbi:hypothetical protein AYI68_g644 [Smittium mucronatum]|uniref:Uncharacterized protein n=1 Tax=Smittium mucronatum TaxID=133383 RepID=A0A1R0H7L2_9FUNG|nr:hypothetical protein AYI68_g644 [Smittium mucronatum]